jgi:hypothetical protein
MSDELQVLLSKLGGEWATGHETAPVSASRSMAKPI